MLIVVWTVIGCLLGLVGLLLFWSYPGSPQPFLDRDGRPIRGSVSEKIRVDVGRVKQGMFIKSKDARNPVLLFLHGGMPFYFLDCLCPTGLEDDFTVCWWEQRGSGLSYNPGIPQSSITVDQLISDTIEVTNYLRRRFRQDRIYLMGHSGGSFLGMLTVARAPELYSAYIGVAQISNQLRSECLSYEYMLTKFHEQQNTRMVRKLMAAPVTLGGGIPAEYLSVRDEAMHLLGVGTARNIRSVVSGIFLPSLQCRDYTAREKFRMWRGKASSGVSTMWQEILATDLAKKVPEIRIPAYFFHGVHDYTCCYAEAHVYFDLLAAPVKGFYTFAQSAHSPIFEEPERMRRILREDVLGATNRLADKI